MSVTNYIPDKCRYLVEKLVKTVYLISEDAVKDIRIDNGDAYINSVSESPIKIDCYSINLQEEENLDERYRFTHTLTFSVNGYANSDDFQGRFYAIVKDNEGTYWLVNPLFPCKVTYTYTLGYEQNHTDFTMATVSNHPVLRLHNFGDATQYECQGYYLDGIDALWLNEKRYTVHDGNSVKYTNDGFKAIEYNQRSATFTETFDGTDTSHQIDFDILFSQYKSSWHYNLLEFKDNLYSAIFRTRNGKYALCGFSFGLQPSFRVSADDTIQSADRIQITLQDAHDVGDAIDFFDQIDYEYLSARTYEYTSEYDGYECVGDGIAKYLLQNEADALGNETGNYKVLEGYTGRFPGLNIVGTFSNVETFPHSECRVEPCRLSTSLPDNIVFNEVGSKVYTLKAGSDWTITHNQGISVSPESGTAGVSYTIAVYNPVTPTETAWITNLVVHYCNGQEHSSTVTVVADEDSCFQNGSVYNISANEQTLTIPTLCCVKKVSERTGVGVVTNIYSSYLTVYVPQNNSGIERTIILLVEFCDGSAANITINQSNLFEKWVDDHTICVGRSKYMVQYKYTGTSPDHCDTRTDETRTVLIETESEDCIYEYRWVLSNQTDCVDYDEYYLYQRQVRVIDSLDPWENVVPAEYSIDGYGTMERVLFKKKSVSCGWVNYAMYRWVDTDDGECFEVKECEDYDQLNVPVCIRDGIVVDSKVSSVYNINSWETGRVKSNVAEILLGENITNDVQAGIVGDVNTGLTIGNDVTSNYFTKNVTGNTVVACSSYQMLMGCGLKYASACGSFNYLLKDTPLDSSPAGTVYVPDWSVTSHRKAYFTATGACQEGSSITVLPITDNPVPIILTEYSTRDTGDYICDGYDKYDAVDILNSSGTVLASDVKGEFIEHHSEDCGYMGPKWVATYRDSHTDSAECGSSTAITQGEITLGNLINVEIGRCVISIGDSAFNDCGSLTSVTIPNSVTSIGGSAFRYCTRLTSIEIPDSVTSIGGVAFYHCIGLTSIGSVGSGASVEIPSNVTNIGDSVFQECTGLTSIDIPDTVTTIGDHTFADCSGLTSVTIGSGVTSIGHFAFSSGYSITSMAIPDNVTTIGRSIFENCTGLTSCTIGSGVTVIDQLAFYRCRRLRSIVIPNNVTTIGFGAFSQCSGLTSIIIPSGVTDIKSYAFEWCNALTSVTVKAATPPTLGNGVFEYTNNCPILVPSQSLSVYQSASGWSNYASRIQAIT